MIGLRRCDTTGVTKSSVYFEESLVDLGTRDVTVSDDAMVEFVAWKPCSDAAMVQCAR
jgi:hypothetical protein